VANDVAGSEVGFGSDYDEVLVVDRIGNVRDLGRSTKVDIAGKVFDMALKLRDSGP
jgi:phosphopantothenoylcysteine synthetase/decarboxylase